MDKTNEEKLAEVEKELAPLALEYNALRERMMPLWSERKRLRERIKEEERADRRRKEKEEYAAQKERWLTPLRLYSDGKTIAEIDSTLGRKHKKAAAELRWGAEEIIFVEEDFDHPLMPAALRYWRESGEEPPTVDLRGRAAGEVSKVVKAFEAAGYDIIQKVQP